MLHGRHNSWLILENWLRSLAQLFLCNNLKCASFVCNFVPNLKHNPVRSHTQKVSDSKDFHKVIHDHFLMSILHQKPGNRVQISWAPQNLSPHIILVRHLRGNTEIILSGFVVFEWAVLIFVIIVTKHAQAIDVQPFSEYFLQFPCFLLPIFLLLGFVNWSVFWWNQLCR